MTENMYQTSRHSPPTGYHDAAAAAAAAGAKTINWFLYKIKWISYLKKNSK